MKLPLYRFLVSHCRNSSLCALCCENLIMKDTKKNNVASFSSIAQADRVTHVVIQVSTEI